MRREPTSELTSNSASVLEAPADAELDESHQPHERGHRAVAEALPDPAPDHGHAEAAAFSRG